MTSLQAGQLVEFRNYRMNPGALDAFVEHFEARFLASQEALGMDIVGQFRVVGADRFVWVRRYLDPSVRRSALTEFYTSPVWKEFGPRANELMLDHTDVHLLVPDPSGPPFAADHQAHADRSADSAALTDPPATVVAAFLAVDERDRLPDSLADAMTAALADHADVRELGRLVTASATNDFPALPVHEDAVVALWLLSGPADGDAASAAAADTARRVDTSLETVLLSPTARSTLR